MTSYLNQTEFNETDYYEDERGQPSGPPTFLAIFNEVLFPSICFVGFLGNVMALVLIQTNTTLKKMHSNVFLSGLAVCSSIFLSTLFIMWIEPYTKTQLFNASLIGCKMVTYCAHWSDFCCSWLIAVVALDRSLLLAFPVSRLRFYQKCSPEKSTVILVGIVGLGHVWLLPTATTVETGMGSECMSDGEYYEVYQAFTILETIFAACVPVVVIAVSNCLTAYKLWVYKRRHEIRCPTVRFSELTSGDTAALYPNGTPENGTLETPVGISPTKGPHTFHGPTSRSRASRDHPQIKTFFETSSIQVFVEKMEDLNLAKSLLLVTWVFVILNLPSYMCRLFLPVFPQVAWQAYMWFFAYRLYYCHHALLFYLYIFNSRQMRKQLAPTAMKLLECYCFKTVPDFGH